jgi:hypothetical protein
MKNIKMIRASVLSLRESMSTFECMKMVLLAEKKKEEKGIG